MFHYILCFAHYLLLNMSLLFMQQHSPDFKGFLGIAITPGEKCKGAMKYPYKNFILKVLKTFLIEGNDSHGGLFKTNHTATSL